MLHLSRGAYQRTRVLSDMLADDDAVDGPFLSGLPGHQSIDTLVSPEIGEPTHTSALSREQVSGEQASTRVNLT